MLKAICTKLLTSSGALAQDFALLETALGRDRNYATPGFQTKKNGGSLSIVLYLCPSQINFLQNPEGLLQRTAIAGWKYRTMLFLMYTA